MTTQPQQPMPPATGPQAPQKDPQLGKFYKRLAIGIVIVTIIVSNLIGMTSGAWWVSVLLTIGVLAVYIYTMRLYMRGKKHMAPTVSDTLAHDQRAPVVYLRSFQDDPRAATPLAGAAIGWAMLGLVSKKTEEELLVDELKPFGPVIAIGKPGEELPELGAARMYVGSDVWHTEVEGQLDKANMVVLRLGPTEGLWWELEQSIKKIRPERLLIIVPHIRDAKKLDEIYRRACSHFPKPLPAFRSARNLMSRLGTMRGLIYFAPDWTPTYVDLTARNWPWGDWPRYIGFAGNESRLTAGLEPLYKQYGMKWTKPSIKWVSTIIVCIGFGFPALLFLILIGTAIFGR